jgi:hypothetical protein
MMLTVLIFIGSFVSQAVKKIYIQDGIEIDFQYVHD